MDVARVAVNRVAVTSLQPQVATGLRSSLRVVTAHQDRPADLLIKAHLGQLHPPQHDELLLQLLCRAELGQREVADLQCMTLLSVWLIHAI